MTWRPDQSSRLRVAAGLVIGALLAADATAATLNVVSPVYTVERIYKSMEGPQSSQSITLLDSPVPELLWITGYRAVMVQADDADSHRLRARTRE